MGLHRLPIKGIVIGVVLVIAVLLIGGAYLFGKSGNNDKQPSLEDGEREVLHRTHNLY
jgi:hypothetical protein